MQYFPLFNYCNTIFTSLLRGLFDNSFVFIFLLDLKIREQNNFDQRFAVRGGKALVKRV